MNSVSIPIKYARNPIYKLRQPTPVNLVQNSLMQYIQDKHEASLYQARLLAQQKVTPTVLTDPLLNLKVREYYREKYERSLGMELIGRTVGAAEGAALGAGLVKAASYILAGVALVASAVTPDAGTLAAGGVTLASKIASGASTASAVLSSPTATAIGAGVGGGLGFLTADYTTAYATQRLFQNTFVDSFKQGLGSGILNSLATTGKSMDLIMGGEAIRATLYSFIKGENVWENIKKAYGWSEDGRTEFDFSKVREATGLDFGNGFVNGVFDFTGEIVTDPGAFSGLVGKAKAGKIVNKQYVESIEAFNKSMKFGIKNEVITKSSFIKTLSKTVLDDDYDNFVKILSDNSNELFEKGLDLKVTKKFYDEVRNSAINKTSYKLYQTFKQIDDFDDWLTFKLIKGTFGYGFAYSSLNKVYSKIINSIADNDSIKFLDKFQGNQRERTILGDVIKSSRDKYYSAKYANEFYESIIDKKVSNEFFNTDFFKEKEIRNIYDLVTKSVDDAELKPYLNDFIKKRESDLSDLNKSIDNLIEQNKFMSHDYRRLLNKRTKLLKEIDLLKSNPIELRMYSSIKRIRNLFDLTKGNRDKLTKAQQNILSNTIKEITELIKNNPEEVGKFILDTGLQKLINFIGDSISKEFIGEIEGFYKSAVDDYVKYAEEMSPKYAKEIYDNYINFLKGREDGKKYLDELSEKIPGKHILEKLNVLKELIRKYELRNDISVPSTEFLNKIIKENQSKLNKIKAHSNINSLFISDFKESYVNNFIKDAAENNEWSFAMTDMHDILVSIYGISKELNKKEYAKLSVLFNNVFNKTIRTSAESAKVYRAIRNLKSTFREITNLKLEKIDIDYLLTKGELTFKDIFRDEDGVYYKLLKKQFPNEDLSKFKPAKGHTSAVDTKTVEYLLTGTKTIQDIYKRLEKLRGLIKNYGASIEELPRLVYNISASNILSSNIKNVQNMIRSGRIERGYGERIVRNNKELIDFFNSDSLNKFFKEAYINGKLDVEKLDTLLKNLQRLEREQFAISVIDLKFNPDFTKAFDEIDKTIETLNKYKLDAQKETDIIDKKIEDLNKQKEILNNLSISTDELYRYIRTYDNVSLNPELLVDSMIANTKTDISDVIRNLRNDLESSELSDFVLNKQGIIYKLNTVIRRLEGYANFFSLTNYQQAYINALRSFSNAIIKTDFETNALSEISKMFSKDIDTLELVSKNIEILNKFGFNLDKKLFNYFDLDNVHMPYSSFHSDYYSEVMTKLVLSNLDNDGLKNIIQSIKLDKFEDLDLLSTNYRTIKNFSDALKTGDDSIINMFLNKNFTMDIDESINRSFNTFISKGENYYRIRNKNIKETVFYFTDVETDGSNNLMSLAVRRMYFDTNSNRWVIEKANEWYISEEAFKTRGYKVTEEVDQLYYSEGGAWAHNANMLNKKNLRGYNPEDIIKEFEAYISKDPDSVLVAHNANFDFGKVLYDNPDRSVNTALSKEYSVIDSLYLYRASNIFTDLKNYKNVSLGQALPDVGFISRDLDGNIIQDTSKGAKYVIEERMIKAEEGFTTIEYYLNGEALHDATVDTELSSMIFTYALDDLSNKGYTSMEVFSDMENSYKSEIAKRFSREYFEGFVEQFISHINRYSLDYDDWQIKSIYEAIVSNDYSYKGIMNKLEALENWLEGRPKDIKGRTLKDIVLPKNKQYVRGSDFSETITQNRSAKIAKNKLDKLNYTVDSMGGYHDAVLDSIDAKIKDTELLLNRVYYTKQVEYKDPNGRLKVKDVTVIRDEKLKNKYIKKLEELRSEKSIYYDILSKKIKDLEKKVKDGTKVEINKINDAKLVEHKLKPSDTYYKTYDSNGNIVYTPKGFIETVKSSSNVVETKAGIDDSLYDIIDNMHRYIDEELTKYSKEKQAILKLSSNQLSAYKQWNRSYINLSFLSEYTTNEFINDFKDAVLGNVTNLRLKDGKDNYIFLSELISKSLDGEGSKIFQELRNMFREVEDGIEFYKSALRKIYDNPEYLDIFDNLMNIAEFAYQKGSSLSEIKNKLHYKITESVYYYGLDSYRQLNSLEDLIMQRVEDAFSKNVNRLILQPTTKLQGTMYYAITDVIISRLHKYAIETGDENIEAIADDLYHNLGEFLSSVRNQLSNFKQDNRSYKLNPIPYENIKNGIKVGHYDETDGFITSVDKKYPWELPRYNSRHTIKFSSDLETEMSNKRIQNKIMNMYNLYKPYKGNVDEKYIALQSETQIGRVFNMIAKASGMRVKDLLYGFSHYEMPYSDLYKYIWEGLTKGTIPLPDYVDAKSVEQFRYTLMTLTETGMPYIADIEKLKEMYITCFVDNVYFKNMYKATDSSVLGKHFSSIKKTYSHFTKLDEASKRFDDFRKFYVGQDGTPNVKAFREFLHKHREYRLAYYDYDTNTIKALSPDSKDNILSQVLIGDNYMKFSLIGKDEFFQLSKRTNPNELVDNSKKVWKFFRNSVLEREMSYDEVSTEEGQKILKEYSTTEGLNYDVVLPFRYQFVKYLKDFFLVPTKLASLTLSIPFIVQNAITAAIQNIRQTGMYLNPVSFMKSLGEVWKSYYTHKKLFNTLMDDTMIGYLSEHNIQWINAIRDKDFMRKFTEYAESTMSEAEFSLYKDRLDIIKNALDDIEDWSGINKIEKYVNTAAAKGETAELQENLTINRIKKEQREKLDPKSDDYYITNPKPNGKFSSLKEELDDLTKKSKRTSKESHRIRELRNMINSQKYEKFYGTLFGKNPVKSFFNFNEDIEHIVRIQLIEELIKEGFTEEYALAKTIDTHFIYDNKSVYEQYAEFTIPFISYPIRAMQQLDELASDSSFMEMVYLWDKLTWSEDDEQSKRSSYLTNRRSRGDIPVGDKLLQLGGNPLLDTARMLENPLEAFNNKLNPFVKPFADLATGAENVRWNHLPYVSQMSNLSNIVKEKNLLANYTSDFYKRGNYTNYYLPRFNNRQYPQFYNKLYTSNGYSRVAMRMSNVTDNNLKYRVNSILKGYTY